MNNYSNNNNYNKITYILLDVFNQEFQSLGGNSSSNQKYFGSIQPRPTPLSNSDM